MCRTYGALDLFGLHTQRLRTGLICGAPPALVLGRPQLVESFELSIL